MGSFGTGLAPGAHGLVGYEVLDPDRDVLLNELSWEPHVDPPAWQPNPTVFEQLVARGAWPSPGSARVTSTAPA